MIKYPKTPRLQHADTTDWGKLSVVVSEKLDGANAGVSFTDGVMLLQSRGHILVGGRREKQFGPFKALCARLRDQLHQRLGERYLLFGEWMYAKHRVFYDALPGYFVTYDLFDKVTERFLSTDRRVDIMGGLLPEAPILHRAPQFRKVHNFSQYIGPSKFKSDQWWPTLQAAAAAVGQKNPLEGTDDSNMMEGVYVKVEDEEHVVGRIKLPRIEFEKVRSDANWFRDDVITNRCIP